MKKETFLSQMSFPAIRHKTGAIAAIGISVLVTLLATVADMLWAAAIGVLVYLVSLGYCVYESIRCRSYLIVLSFIGMMAIGVYFLLILFGFVR